MRWLAGCVALASLLLCMAASPPQKPQPIMAATPISRMDLPWWRTRHEAKLEALRRKQPELIFLGDSITQQYEYRAPPDWKDFAPVWDRFYGHRKAVNLGFSGDTTASLLWRIENGEVSGIAPKVAIVLIGANNLGRLRWSAEHTLAGIDAILLALRKRLPTTRILLLGVLPSDRSAWTTETTLTINKALAARFPRGHEVAFVDVSPVFMRNGVLNRELYYDPKLTPPAAPLHPSPAGQALMAEAIEPTLAALLAGRPPR